MRVFVTGASGFIGSAVVPGLIAAGHQVTGLARGEASAAALAATGAAAHPGDLTDLGSLTAAVREADGVIHLAFVHDWGNYAASVETDRKAVESMTQALKGSGKPLVIASGTLMVSHVRPTATETDKPPSLDAPRAASEALVIDPAAGIRGSVVRLAPSVHDQTRGGLVSLMAGVAKAKGVSGYIGDGQNRWPAVHVSDAARLFHLALEQAAPGARLHAAAEELTLRVIAEAVGAGLGLPVRSIAPEDAFAHFQGTAMFMGLDNPVSSAITRQTLGWDPRGPGLLADLGAVADWQTA